MNDLLNLLKGAAPALATAVAGPMGGLAIKAIADKLGVPASITDVTQALQANPDMTLKLKEIDTNAFEIEQKNVSDRWNADMASDSWLSKNIRPMSLIAILGGYFIFAMMSAFGYNANESYVTLLGNWGMLVFGAYFGSRSLEKITEMRSRK
jgi:phage tail sheath gpL-like